MLVHLSHPGAARAAVLPVALALCLSACGGSPSPSPTPTPTPAPTPAPSPTPTPDEVVQNAVGPGQFKEAQALKTFTAAEISVALTAAGGKAPAVTPSYAVKTYRVTYLTTDADGKEALASGLAAIPDKPATALSPVMSYQHATLSHDAEAPSNQAVPYEAAVVMASSGYIVIAADYVGYGVSKGQLHPYLLATPSAAAVNDFITATRYWRYTQKIRDNKQLFLAGYSEGGYVTLAAHRALQQNKHPLHEQLVASAPGAGAYHFGVTMDNLLLQLKAKEPVLAALLNPGFLKLLGASDRRRVRDALMKASLDDTADVLFSPRFLDNYLVDDVAAIERDSNVHDWAPQRPVYLYHGRDDKTVPYPSATTTVQAMQARGAGAQVALSDCPAQPAGHLECVLPYWNFMLEKFALLARDR